MHNALNGLQNQSAEGEAARGAGSKGEEEQRGVFFRERPRTEVARGGTPSVGGPVAELKLMDKGRQPRNFHRIKPPVLAYYPAIPVASSRGPRSVFDRTPSAPGAPLLEGMAPVRGYNILLVPV